MTSISTPSLASGVSVADDRMRVHRALVAVLALALIVRVILLAGVSQAPLITDDERDYVEIAQNITAGRGFARTELGTTSIRPPLYPAFIAGVWALSGQQTLQAVRVAQIPLALGTLLLVFWVARELFGDRTGVIAATLWALYPSYLYAGTLLLSEVLFTFLMMLGVALGVRTTQRPRFLVALGTGTCIGLAALTRSVLWPFPVVLIPAAIFALHHRPRVAASVAIGLLVGHIAVIAPWAVRNTRLQHTLSFVDTMGGLNLRMGNFEHTLEDRMWDGVSLKGDKAWAHQMWVEHPEATSWTEGQREKWAQAKALEYMKTHVATTARRSLLKFADFWGLEREYVAALSAGLYSPPRWFAALSAFAVLTVYPAVVLLAWMGIAVARPRDKVAHGLLLLMVAFICGLHAIVFGHSRYHLPLMAILVIYASAVQTVNWRALDRAQLSAIAVGVTLFAIVWGREVLLRDAERIALVLQHL